MIMTFLFTNAFAAGAAEDWPGQILTTYGGRLLPGDPLSQKAQEDLGKVPEDARNWLGHHVHVMFNPVVDVAGIPGITFSMPEVLSAFSTLARSPTKRGWFQEVYETLQLQAVPDIQTKRSIVVMSSQIRNNKRYAFFDVIKQIPQKFRPLCSLSVFVIIAEIPNDKINKFYSKFLGLMSQLREDKERRPDVVPAEHWCLYEKIVKDSFPWMNQPE